jgi:NAD(P)-dependent dehydrogenase (short-subunit alcohol dehydrogenase family)
MEKSFSGKTVLITGGSRGQGAAEARLFAQAGAGVIIADVLDAEGGALAHDIAAKGERAEYCHLDVTDEADWQNAVALAKEKFGALHVLINNAGIALRGKNIGQTTRADWDRVLATNLTGPFLGTRAAAPLIRDSGGGAIVNTGSTAGINGHFAAAYSAAKWGLRGLTKCAAMEYADWNIRVNAVHPGIVTTPMVEGSNAFVEAMTEVTALNRPATAEDVARCVMFLASDDASYLTGIDLPVDGGFTALGVYRRAGSRRSSVSAGEGAFHDIRTADIQRHHRACGGAQA